jgi:hypothetical protein
MMIANYEYEGMWKEAVVTCIMVQSWQYTVGAEESHEYFLAR